MKAWCVKNPEGRLCLRWVDWWKSNLKEDFISDKLHGSDDKRTWRSFSRKGWRIVRVEITEEPK